MLVTIVCLPKFTLSVLEAEVLRIHFNMLVKDLNLAMILLLGEWLRKGAAEP